MTENDGPLACIFCYRQPPEIVLTDEHVFPEAIGGTLRLRTVCKPCNDRLGSFVDAALTESFLIAMIRSGLRLGGKSGRIPTPLRDAPVANHPGHHGTLHAQGPNAGKVSLRPVADREVGDDGVERVRIVAEARDAEAILSKLRARATRDGLRMRVCEQGEQTFKSPVLSKTVPVHAFGVARPLLKIAYELGIYWLGADYATHVTGLPIAEAVRSGVPLGVECDITYFPRDGVVAGWPVPDWWHGARLEITEDGIWTRFRVFNVLEARVQLVDVTSEFPNAVPRWLTINPIARTSAEGLGHDPAPLPQTADVGLPYVETLPGVFHLGIRYGGKEVASVVCELAGGAGG